MGFGWNNDYIKTCGGTLNPKPVISNLYERLISFVFRGFPKLDILKSISLDNVLHRKMESSLGLVRAISCTSNGQIALVNTTLKFSYTCLKIFWFQKPLIYGGLQGIHSRLFFDNLNRCKMIMNCSSCPLFMPNMRSGNISIEFVFNGSPLFSILVS